MADVNKTTIQSYENNIQAYIEGTPREVSDFIVVWLTKSLDGLSLDARILELGTAFGRDADYIEELGYHVERTDVTKGFIDLLQSRGKKAEYLNALTDELGGSYNLILANAVLLHFSRDQARTIVHKVFDALVPGGKFAMTLKIGDGEVWSSEKLNAPRYFCYWQEHGARELLEQAGFTDITITTDPSKHNGVEWMAIISTKQAADVPDVSA